jgi:hypothetical protein
MAGLTPRVKFPHPWTCEVCYEQHAFMHFRQVLRSPPTISNGGLVRQMCSALPSFSSGRALARIPPGKRGQTFKCAAEKSA